MRVEQPAALAADHDPEPVALGEIEPARRVNPDVIERLLLKRCKLARACVVRHRKTPSSPYPVSIPDPSCRRTPLPNPPPPAGEGGVGASIARSAGKRRELDLVRPARSVLGMQIPERLRDLGRVDDQVAAVLVPRHCPGAGRVDGAVD